MTVEAIRTLPVLAPNCGDVEVGFMEVTPAMAETWLSLLNIGNRRLDQKWLAAYSRDMQNGAWRINGEAIKFAGDFEVLLDGQTRLAAQVRANVVLTYLVVTGLTRPDQESMDHGRPRTLTHVLSLRGVPSAKSVAAVVRGIYNYEKSGSAIGASAMNERPSIHDLLDVFERNPDVHDFLVPSPVTGISPGMASTFYYLADRVDHEDAVEFMRLLRTGDGLAIGNPIHTLRERMLKDTVGGRASRMSSEVRWVFLVRAWVAWRGGESLTKLQFKPGGARPDRIPRIEDGVA